MSHLTRRRVIAAGTLLGVAGAAALRPADKGAPAAPYFGALARALKAAGCMQPTLVIDRERLRGNAERLRAHAQGRLQLRLVNKSLPCLALLDEVGRLTGTRRQMVFNLPYLELVTREQPHCEVLMGKPLPVAAAAQYLARRPAQTLSPQWLLDTPERLVQYRALARARQQPMRVNLELDVGLHRGGIADVSALRVMLQLIMEEPLLQWSGFMGYDAHTEKLPDLGGWRAQARAQVLTRYRAFVDEVRASPLAASLPQATLNTGGSPTFRLHDGRGDPNEVAVGSALVKPADFDTPLLADFEPAAYIATPVLKVADWQAPDGVQGVGQLLQQWDRNQRRAHFVHGGHWLAEPVAPAGLQTSALMGLSSNQQLLLGSGAQDLRPDDLVFCRPTQSEAVLQQFGDIAVYEAGRIQAYWPVFPAAG